MANMAMLSNAKNVQISGGEFTMIHGNKSPMEVLYEKSAPGASHDSQERFDAPKCLPETRVAVIDDIVLQIKIAVVSTIIWLYGAAGAGKSSIAQTIAEMCSKEQLLIGDFFFFRTAPLRNNAQRLAASLAYLLAQTIPSTLQYIAASIQKNPGIFDRSLEKQLQQLFVEPLRQACENDPQLCPSPRLLILDGLDECDTPQVQQYLLKVLGKVLQTTPIPIVVLVACRPEPHISTILNSPEDLSQITTFPIGLNEKYNADTDIRLYTNAKLNHTKFSHPLKKFIPEDWPASGDVDLIVQKSSGQFIFAATIARFVESIHHKPHDQLRIALDASKHFSSNVGNSPFAALDALYMQILNEIGDKVMVLALLYHVLGIKPVDRAPFSKDGSADDITSRFNLVTGDVEMYLSKLASLVKFEQQDEPIRVYHASLQDFLLDEKRSHGFYIQQQAVILFLSKIYLNHILNRDRDLRDSISVGTEFLKLSPHPDEKLSDIVSQLEKEFPTILHNHLVSWKQWRSTSSNTFRDFIREVENLSNAVKFHVKSTTFWDQCLGAIYEFLKHDLQPFLEGDNPVEILPYMAFVPLPSSSFAEHCFGAFSVPLCFSIAPNGTPHSIVCDFLLDESLSGGLAIPPSNFSQTALACAKFIEPNILWIIAGHEPPSEDENCAIVGLTKILKYAPRDDRLIQSLKRLTAHFLSLSNPAFPFLLKAITSYLDDSEANLKDSLLSESHAGARSISKQPPPTSGPHPIEAPSTSEPHAIEHNHISEASVKDSLAPESPLIQVPIASEAQPDEVSLAPEAQTVKAPLSSEPPPIKALPKSEAQPIEEPQALESEPDLKVPLASVSISHPIPEHPASKSHLIEDPPVKISRLKRVGRFLKMVVTCGC